MSKLNGKVAVVTGASKGLGASIAEHLAAEGASVVVNYATSKAAAEAVVSRIAKKGGKATAVQGDVAKPAEIERLFNETKSAYGRLDILVNNAVRRRIDCEYRFDCGSDAGSAGFGVQREQGGGGCDLGVASD
jgi:NAD(P)-dependent dehydrogenase (short-subunit alcohol dehydrogenase family)